MGAQQSKDELLYEQVNYGNIEGIRSLRSQGAGLEWMDKEGKTPLIVACLRHDLLNVAKVLIELGANVNAYRPGSHAGTPLHHAAKKGLEQTVHLLLSHGANPFIMNGDCHSALDLAREKGHVNVVRAVESRISLFAGWLRENYGPGFLEALAPQLMSRKIWAVVLPCDARNPTRPVKFELVVYPDLQVAKPRTSVSLWKCHIEEPKYNQADPSVIIVEKATKTRYKFLSAHEGDKQQIQWFYNACCGIPQITNIVPIPPIATTIPNPLPITPVLGPSAGAPTSNQEDLELTMAINASIQSAIAEGVPDVHPIARTDNTNGWGLPDPAAPSKAKPSNSTYNGWVMPELSSNASSSEPCKNQIALPTPLLIPPPIPPPITASSSQEAPSTMLVPSAPPIMEDALFDGPIQYPLIDSSPIELTMLSAELKQGGSVKPEKLEAEVGSGSDSSGACVICLDAPVEGACIPCGHMAGCMSCLREIEAKKWGCPVCRAKIERVIKLYAV